MPLVLSLSIAFSLSFPSIAALPIANPPFMSHLLFLALSSFFYHPPFTTLRLPPRRHPQDAEQQMILTARRSLVANVARHQPPQIDIFFLNINIRRNYLVEDSLKEVRWYD